MKIKLTKRSVESKRPGPRDAFLWDTELPGFGCKITPKGARVYLLQYWHGGRARRFTIGRHGIECTAEEARRKASYLRGLVADGKDPAAAKASEKGSPMLAVFANRYLSEHAAVKKKASSKAADERNLNNHVLPALGHRKITEITRADVARFHQSMKRAPGAANRCLALLSKMFNLAERWGLRADGTNPTRHVEKYPERKLERFLSDGELAHLGRALSDGEKAGEPSSAIAAIRLLILTGCRLSEILTLEWRYVDCDNRCIRLPDSKTGAKLVPLGAPAVELLATLPRAKNNPYVLPGAKPSQHFVGLERAWYRLRERATLAIWRADPMASAIVEILERKLKRQPICGEIIAAAKDQQMKLPGGLLDVRIHDLRHSFASVGASMGESLVLIGSILGHVDSATTARYAHLSNNPRQAAADRVSGRVAALMAGVPSGQVVPMRGGKRV
jgi:integrase